jgi:hypothetical protein
MYDASTFQLRSEIRATDQAFAVRGLEPTKNVLDDFRPIFLRGFSGAPLKQGLSCVGKHKPFTLRAFPSSKVAHLLLTAGTGRKTTIKM